MPSKWTDEQRAEALQLVRDGVSVRDIEARTGIAKSVVARWARDAGIDSPRAEQTAAATEATKLAWAQRRATLVDRFGEVAEKLLDRIEDDEQARDAKDLMTAAAIAVDKAQLLSGGATSRHEQLDAQRRRDRVEELADELEQRRRVKDGTTGG